MLTKIIGSKILGYASTVAWCLSGFLFTWNPLTGFLVLCVAAMLHNLNTLQWWADRARKTRNQLHEARLRLIDSGHSDWVLDQMSREDVAA